MAQTIVISADALMLVSKHLKVPAETVKRAVTTFNTAIQAIGEPWGTDEIGANWSKIYTPGLQISMTAFKDIIEGLIKLSNDFQFMGLSYEFTENTNSH